MLNRLPRHVLCYLLTPLSLTLWGHPTTALSAPDYGCSNPIVENAITQDPLPDPAHPARTEEVLIRAKDGSGLSGVLYVASAEGMHPTVLLLHGYPGADASRDLAQAIRRSGWNVLIFHYRGTWGSAGAFSIGHSIEDTDTALAFLRDDENARKYSIDRQRLVLIGHSLGGFLALNTAGRHPKEVLGVGAISAVNLGDFVGTTPEQMKTAKDIVATTAPISQSTPDILIADIQIHQKQWNYLTYVPQLRTLPVLVLEAKDPFASDDAALAAALRSKGDKRVSEQSFDTGHDFDDHRIALERAVLVWLTRL
jgi:uncharacterized protein